MCGVAQIASMPSAAACRAIPTLSREIECPVVDAGKDVAVEVDHAYLDWTRLRCKPSIQGLPCGCTRLR